MRKILMSVLSLILLASSFLFAFSEDRPALQQCASIHIRLSDGWWLRINHDGSGAYGFGTGMAKVKVVKNSFEFEQVYGAIEGVFIKKQEGVEELYMAVSYFREGASSAVEYRLMQDRTMLTKLFVLARANIHPPENEFETRSFNQVESFWRNSIWREGHQISPM